MTPAPRSWLYVPGHRGDRLDKAVASGADAVVVDLEDSVAAEHKHTARAGALALLGRRRSGPQIWVRINPPGTPEWSDDLAALAGAPADGLRLPRVEDPNLVRTSASRSGLPLQLLIESAAGLQAVEALAAADPAVVGVGLGETDLAADLLVSDEGLDWARGRLVVACRAAGLASPVQSVWTDVADLAGLHSSSARGLALGFFGRSIVHPRQIAVVHEVFTPTAEDLADAAEVVHTAELARRAGESAALDRAGRFVDPAVVARASTVLDRAQHTDDPTASDGGARR